MRRSVTYELGRDEHGRPRAREVRYADAATFGAEAGRAGRQSTAQVSGASTNARLGMTRTMAGASAVTFLLYGWDKTAAEGGHRRTPEATLNAFAMLGGWPGAWVAQQAFRHKYRKRSFQAGFWMAVAVNVAAFGWLVLTGGMLPD